MWQTAGQRRDRMVTASRGYTPGGRRLDVLSSMWEQDFLEYGSEDDIYEDVSEGDVQTVRRKAGGASQEELDHWVSLTSDISDDQICPQLQYKHKLMLVRCRRIIGYLREYGVISMSDIARLLHTPRPSTQYTLQHLYKMGLITRHKHTWMIPDWKNSCYN